MQEIRPLNPACPEASDFDAVAFTSRYAAAVAMDGAFHGKECYCVGEATAREAEKAGFRNVVRGAGDGAALAGLIGDSKPRRVLWASAADIGFDMGEALAGMGIDVARLAVYEATLAPDLPAEALAALRDGSVEVVLAHSGRAGGRFRDLTDRHGLEQQRRSMTLVAVSPRAAGLCGDGWHTITIADSPSRAAMLDAAVKAVAKGGPRRNRGIEG